MIRRVVQVAMIVCLLVGLPLLGVIVAGKPLWQYLEFPPVTRYVEPASFSWVAFAGVFLFIGAVVLPFVVMVGEATRPRHVYLVRGKPLPWWGWLGLGFLALAWTLAWTRFSWFEVLQPYTFTPLWVGYIVVVNALIFQRTGHCMLLDRPGYFLSLFPLSAALWWFFEYLNRFVQNWYYVGVSEFSSLEYVVHATLPFSTVLPAVLGTIQCLETFPRLEGAFRDLWPVEARYPSLVGWGVLVVASAGLMGIGLWPNYLFPLLWVSPLLIITSLQAVLGEDTIFSTLRNGDWRQIWLPALAGLICGFFWELWNSRSLAHWEYAVPYVHSFQLFEMPLLGYAGYLPFGIECVVVARLLLGQSPTAGSSG